MTAFAALIEDMGNWDKDKRFMAASDLTNEITTTAMSLDPHLQKRICSAFVKQLEDASIEVQGNAVKCLARIVCKFHEQLIGEAAGKLAQLVLEGNEKVRDIYATCLKGLLLELNSNQSGAIVCQSVLPRMLSGIHSVSTKPEVKEECVDVLCEVLRRFGDNSRIQADKMTQGLLNLLQTPGLKQVIRKKTTVCIGILSTVLLDRQLDQLLRTLLQMVKQASAGGPAAANGSSGTNAGSSVQRASSLALQNAEAATTSRMMYIQCISTIARYAPGRVFASHVNEIVPLFLQICKDNCRAADDDEEGAGGTKTDNKSSTEVVESCLNAFESFCGKLKEMGDDAHFNPLMDLLLRLVTYDPNYYNDPMDGSYGADDDDYEDDDYDFEEDSEEDDQESWKIRRAAFKLSGAMTVGIPQRLSDMYDKFAATCLQRFAAERDPNVKVDAFRAMEQLVRAACGSGGGGTSSSSSTTMLGKFSSGGATSSTAAYADLQLHHASGGGGASGLGKNGFVPPARGRMNGLIMQGASSSGSGGRGPLDRSLSQGTAAKSQQKLIALMPTLVPAIAKQLSGKSKQGALALLRTLSHLLPNHLEPFLLDNKAAADSFLQGLADSSDAAGNSKNATASQMTLDTLVILRNLVSAYTNPAVYQRLAPSIIPHLLKICEGGSCSYYKCVAEALKVLSAFMYPLWVPIIAGAVGGEQDGDTVMQDTSSLEPGSSFAALLRPLLGILQEKMQKTDIDQDVKEASLECLGHTLACTGDFFKEDAHKCLPPFVERLRNEMTRMQAISALKAMCQSSAGGGSAGGQIEIGNEMLHTMCTFLTSYLSQNQRALRQQSLDCLGCLLRQYPGLPEETQLLAVSATSAFFSDTDLYLTDLAIQVLINSLGSPAGMNSVKISEVVAQRCLPGILNCTRSPLLQGGALNSILKFLNKISFQSQNLQLLDVSQLYKQLMQTQPILERAPSAQAARNVVRNLAKCVAALAIVSPSVGSILNDFVTQLQEQLHLCVGGEDKDSGGAVDQQAGVDDQLRLSIELALLCLGEVGKFVDLSAQQIPAAQPLNGVQGLLLTYLEFKDAHDDDVAHAAAVALGYATMGSKQVFLSALVDKICSCQESKTQYLLLTGFREVMSLEYDSGRFEHSDDSLLHPYLGKILAILETHAESKEEGVRSIAAECLGFLVLVEPRSALDSLKKMMAAEQTSAKVRACAVAAVRYCVAKRSDALKDLIPQFVRALEDPDVLLVRKAALQSVSTMLTSAAAASCLEKTEVEYITQRCLEEGKIKPQFIREVDLGPFKHKVDDGLPVRKMAFLVLSDLVAAFPQELVPFAQQGQLLAFLAEGFQDADDIQVLASQLLGDCAESFWLSATLPAHLDKVVEPVERAIQRNSKLIQQKSQTMNKAVDMLRCFARMLKRMLQEAGDSGDGGAAAALKSCKVFADFVGRSMKDPTFVQLYEKAA
eukprot:g10569.t1